jgi:nuclease-like protein
MPAWLKRRPRAGRYVDEWYWRTYRPWRRQTRVAFAIVAPFLGIRMMSVAVIWPRWWQFYAGCALGALATLYVCLLEAPPEWIARKRRGRDAERQTEKQLLPLERRGWHVLHDIAQPRGNFDHLVLGPPGVFLLETKTFTGQTTLAPDGALVVTRGADDRDNWTARSIGQTV